MAQVLYDTYTQSFEPSFVAKRIDSHSWGVTPLPPVVPPVISNYSPTPGDPIYLDTPIEFDVTDNVGLTSVIIEAEFSGISGVEGVFNGTDFAAPYLAGSVRSTITGGFHFYLLRTGGWPGSLTLTAHAFDGAQAP